MIVDSLIILLLELESFIQKLVNKHAITHEVPATREITGWVMDVLKLLFPEVTEERHPEQSDIRNVLDQIAIRLKGLLYRSAHCVPEQCDVVVKQFLEELPQIYDRLMEDLAAFMEGDPAAKTTYEVVRTYPGFFAVFIYRIAHQLHTGKVSLIPRILSEFAHSKTGIDIHPGASIGRSFCIDHGTGVVIGETAVIGHHVKIYQGVTLGALSVEKSMADKKRHPTVGDHTVIYSGATILGGSTVIGANSIIGGNVWLTTSVPEGTKVLHNADNTFAQNIKK